MSGDIREQISEYNPEAVVFEGLDEAIIGIGQQWGSSTVAIYDREKAIEIFQKNFIKEGADPDQAYVDAVEYFEFNVECVYVGEHTPIIISLFPPQDMDE